MTIQLMKNHAGLEYLQDDKQLGKIIWTLDNGIMIMNGTYLDPSLRGKNIGMALLEHAANYARENSYKMKAVCPFVVKKFEETSNFNDLKI